MKEKFNQKIFFDLSHPITHESPCTFQSLDINLNVTFQESNTPASFTIATRLDNFVLNAGTHLVFPGCLPRKSKEKSNMIGLYPIDRFIGHVAVIDVSPTLNQIIDFFDYSGKFHTINWQEERYLNFLKCLDNMEISLKTVQQEILNISIINKNILGVLFYTGLSKYWVRSKFESWEYIYFFSPFLQKELCEHLIQAGISFVGIDSFHLEHPLVNFQGYELPITRSHKCKEYLKERIAHFDDVSNKKFLLDNDVFIYQNLNICSSLKGSVIEFYGVPWNFQIKDSADSSPVRPFARPIKL